MYMQAIHFDVIIVIMYGISHFQTFSKKSQPRRLKGQAFRVK